MGFRLFSFRVSLSGLEAFGRKGVAALSVRGRRRRGASRGVRVAWIGLGACVRASRGLVRTVMGDSSYNNVMDSDSGTHSISEASQQAGLDQTVLGASQRTSITPMAISSVIRSCTRTRTFR